MDRPSKPDSASKEENVQEQQNDACDPRSLEAVYGNIPLVRDNVDESDGQRRSLSLDEDGGTHFDNSDSLETVVRRNGAVRDDNIGGATFKDVFEDNDILFNPAQRLNFDDEEEEDDEDEKDESEDEDGNKGSKIMQEEVVRDEEMVNESDREDDNDELALVVHDENIEPEDGSDYLHHRPWVSGSDLVEDSASPAMGISQSQSQNVRIIEGHDSSLLDDGNPGGSALYQYNFLQSQMSPLSPVSSFQPGAAVSDNENQNLYDTLETVPNPYGAPGENIGDTNTSEYYSLMATSSSGNISDSFWQQEEVPLQRIRTGQPMLSHPVNQNLTSADVSRDQSPPRNFQLDHVHMSSGIKDSQAFGVDGNVNVPVCLADAQEGLNMELSEEGLSQNTQIYAQPIPDSSTCNVELSAIGGVPSSDRGDAGFMSRQGVLNGSIYTFSGNQQLGTEHPLPPAGVSYNSRGINSQPKNLAQSKSGGKMDVAVPSVYPEVKVPESNMDRRQAGAGSSTSFNDKNQPSKGNKGRAIGAVSKKAQIRRPAVQGSASAGDQKRSSAVANSHPASAGPSTNTSGKMTSMSARVKAQGSVVVSQGAKPKQPQVGGVMKLQTSSAVSGHTTAKHNQDSPLASRTNSHTSLASVGSSNSRVSGVGKESHHYQSGQVMNLSQPSDSHPGNALPHRADHIGQMKQSMMLSGGHPQGAFCPQHMSHSNFPPQRVPQMNQMHELHAGDVRTFPQPQSQGFVINSHAHSQGKISHQYPPVAGMVGNAQALTNAQAYHMGSLPSQTLSPCGSDSSHHSYNREAVVTQMESMKKVMNQSALSGNEMYSTELQSIEDMRSHLHNMLHIGTDHDLSGMENVETASELLTDQPVNRQLHFDTDSSSIFGNKAGEDMSEILENFPAFSSKMFSDVSASSGKNESHVHSENQYLRETLEKERYRRKHCEDQIQRLNTKLLEIQQQLAVAVSTDKRKDSMIEQLDKQLAKVVEGWKKRESDKDEALKTLTEEKSRIEESLQRQQAMIHNFEHDLAQTVDELKEERTKSSETIHGLRKELAEVSSTKDKAEENLDAMNKKCESMTNEWDSMKKSQAIAEMRAQQAQEKLIKEQDVWMKKEQELLDKIAQVKEANQKVINMEKVKLEEQKKRREAAESEAQELKAELKKLVLDTEQLVREKESQKVEVSIMEAKFESAQRKLEADLHAQMEKEIADQASEFHTRLENAMEEASERHRTQVAEIHKRHQKDMERQMAAANEEGEKKDDEYKKQIADLEGRLSDARSENSNLKQSKLKLESQRMEILTKLQFMMQSQWNEAVSLLVSTPQKKGVQSSFLSASGGLPLASLSASISHAPQPGMNAVSPQPAFPSPHKPKAADSQNGRKSSSSSSSRERNDAEDMTQLERVEEYLHRLNVQAEAPMSGDDSHTSESGSAILVRGEKIQETDSLSQTSQQPVPGEQTNQTQAFFDNDSNSHIKPSYSPSQLSNPPQKHRPIQINGNLPVSGGLPVNSGSLPHSFQALPIRSPQQMTRLARELGYAVSIESKGMDHGLGTKTALDPQFKENPVSHGNKQFYSQSHATSYAQHPPLQQENFFVQYHLPTTHSNLSKLSMEQNGQKDVGTFIPTQMPGLPAHVYGDSGDQVNHSQPHQNHHHSHLPQGLDPNPNLYKSSGGSPAFVTSSPSGITPISSTAALKSGKEHNWSPDNSSSYRQKMYVSQSPPGASQGANSFTYNMESPQKWSSRPAKRMGNVNASLSPPVRQTAEKDQTDVMSEASSGVTDPRLEADYSHLSERMDKHSSRHEELQHYIQLLLQKAPGSVAIEAERDIPHDMDVLESSRDLTDVMAEGESVDLDLNDTAQAQELTSQLTRLQELRERQQSSAANQHQNWSNVHRPPQHLAEYIGENGVMNAQGLSEISQLLSLYREQWELNPEMAKQVNTAGQLIQALKVGGADASFETAPRNDLRKQPGAKGSPKGITNKKPRDNTSNKSKKKTTNQVADVSIATTVDSLERSHNSTKGGNVLAVTAKKSQEVVKDTRKVNSASVAKTAGKGGPVWK